MSELVTGEAVALDLRTAALPSRAVAAILDALLQGVLLVVIALLAVASSADLSEAAGQALGVLTLVIVLIGYYVGFETLLRGRTPGKAALGLRVVRDDGGPIGFRQALVRGLSGAFLEKPGISLFVLPVVCSLLNPRDKRLGDLLAGTIVLQERVAVRGGTVAVMPPQLEAWARTLELSRLPDDLALSVRQFVSRAPQLTPAARETLGARLVAAVQEVTAPPPPPGTPGWAFLSAVLAERRRRETERLAAHGGGPAAAQVATPRYGPGPAPDASPAPVDSPPEQPGDRPGGFALPS